MGILIRDWECILNQLLNQILANRCSGLLQDVLEDALAGDLQLEVVTADWRRRASDGVGGQRIGQQKRGRINAALATVV